MAENKKKKYKDEQIAAAVAGGGTLGAGFVDLRPKAKVKGSKYLGSNWKQVKKHVKAGDVIIGANRTAPEALKSGIKDFKEYYKEERKLGKTRRQAFKTALPQLDTPSIVSKFSNPNSSHAAVFSTKGGAVSYGGGSWSHITEAEIPKDKTWENYLKNKRGQNAHFVLLRPKKGVSKIPELTKKKGEVGTLNIVAKKAGGQKDYKGIRAIGNQIVDWVTPKFRRKEKTKNVKQLARESCYIGGTCGTTGALMSEKTVGGKTAPKVLPKDYLRSADYEVVGKIGKGKAHPISKAMFALPKYLVKGTAALGVAGATYGGVKAYKKFKSSKDNKIIKTAEIYQNAFIDELNKIANYI